MATLVDDASSAQKFADNRGCIASYIKYDYASIHQSRVSAPAQHQHAFSAAIKNFCRADKRALPQISPNAAKDNAARTWSRPDNLNLIQ